MCQCTATYYRSEWTQITHQSKMQFTALSPHIIGFQFCLDVKVCFSIFNTPSYILARYVSVHMVPEDRDFWKKYRGSDER